MWENFHHKHFKSSFFIGEVHENVYLYSEADDDDDDYDDGVTVKTSDCFTGLRSAAGDTHWSAQV